VYAMRVDAFGDRLWQENGVPVCQSTFFQSRPRLLSDGSGGAIIAWSDQRADSTSEYSGDIYAQRLDALGIARWTPNGVPLCVAPWPQYVSGISPDADGGAIVVWDDYRSGSGDIYAQRVSGEGQALWTDGGIGLCVQEAPQVESIITADGFGGAIVGWVDWRSSLLGPGSDVYVQRVSGAGVSLWATDGGAVATASFSQIALALAPDGLGGAIIAWEDGRSGTSMDIYAQRISPDGQLGDPPSAVETPEAGATLQLLASPNPAEQEARLVLRLPRPGAASLRVYDASGRLLSELALGALAAGEHSVEWNRRDTAGRPIAGGLCFFQLDVGGRTVARKLVVNR
jgi:hypothetical protein